MSEYSLRPLEERDLQMVLQWRNSERVHSKMLTDHKIVWEEHFAWFQRIKDNPIKRNLIFEFLGRPIGYIGYTEYDEEKGCCSPVHIWARQRCRLMPALPCFIWQ